MAQLGGTFNAHDVDPASRPPALPTGWYNVMISSSEMKTTKAGNGKYLEIVLKVMDGPFAGRTAYDRLNLINPNPVAAEIAQKTLSAICHATGVMQVSDSQQLHGIPMQARLLKKDAEGDYDESNDVKGYAKIGSHQTVQQGPAASAPAAAAAPQAVPSWANQQPTPAPQPQPAPNPAPQPAPQPTPAPNPTPAPAPAPQPTFTPPAPTPAPAPAPQPEAPAAAAASGGDTTPPWLRQ